MIVFFLFIIHINLTKFCSLFQLSVVTSSLENNFRKEKEHMKLSICLLETSGKWFLTIPADKLGFVGHACSYVTTAIVCLEITPRAGK